MDFDLICVKVIHVLAWCSVSLPQSEYQRWSPLLKIAKHQNEKSQEPLNGL